jgi:hypothetical protein
MITVTPRKLKVLLLKRGKVCLTATLGLAACSVYRSSVVSNDASDPSQSAVVAHGSLQPYFLPRGFVRLEIKQIGEATLIKKQELPTPAKSATPSEQQNDATKVEGASPTPNSTPKDDSANPKGDVKEPKTDSGGPAAPIEPALPDMPVTDIATAWAGTTQVHIRMTTVLAPDYRRGPIYSRFVGSVLSHDQPKLDVNERHLLSSSTTTTEDKTPQILEDLTDVTVNVMKTFAQTAIRGVLPPKEIPVFPIDVDVTFDPMDSRAVSRINQLIADTHFYVAVNGHENGPYNVPPASTKAEEGGLRFRLPMACDVVLIYHKQNQAKRIVHSATVPDPSREYLFVVSRGAFISKTTHIRVKDGMARGFDIDKPSELQGLTGSLVAITGKIVSVPKDLLSLRVDYKKQETSLTEAEKQYYDTQKQLLESQHAYAAALKGEPTPTPRPQ